MKNNKYYKLADALKNGEELKITITEPQKYALDLTLDELCDLLIAVNVQEKEYLKLAEKNETDFELYNYFRTKANRLHGIGNMLHYIIFNEERNIQ